MQKIMHNRRKYATAKLKFLRLLFLTPLYAGNTVRRLEKKALSNEELALPISERPLPQLTLDARH